MSKTSFKCSKCGYETFKWMGKCPNCGAFASFKEQEEVQEKKEFKSLKINKIKFEKQGDSQKRISSGFTELDLVLGTGFIRGEVILLGGQPGIGKTTILLQVINNLLQNNINSVYISAEESQDQIGIHCQRLGLRNEIPFISSDNVDEIVSTLNKIKPAFVVVDSIQTINTQESNGFIGGVGQVKACAEKLIDFAKKTGTIIIIIGHINKDGDIAGPKVLEHLVDTVLYLEGEKTGYFRIIRCIKNRFGSTRETAIFNFDAKGFKDALNPSMMFLSTQDSTQGVARGVIIEGNRSIAVEIQALTSPNIFSVPQRIVRGVSKTKVQMLCAVLGKFLKLRFNQRDVYVNIASGLKTDDPSLDLPICIALLSSYLEKDIKNLPVAIGEVGLTGVVSGTFIDKQKVENLNRLGLNKFILPSNIEINSSNKKIDIQKVKNIQELVRFFKK